VHDLVSGNIVPNPTWAGLFDAVELVIGGQLIDTQDYPYSSQVWPVLESTNWSQSTVPTSFYPLHFFFCQDWSRAFPLCALAYHDLTIRIRGGSTQYQFKLWCSMLHLSEYERKWFMTTPQKLLITQTQRTLITKDQNEFQRFSGPIKYLATQVYNYQGLYDPLSAISPDVFDTSVNQTYKVSYYNPYNTPISWVYSDLPSGVSVVSQSNTQIVFLIAAGTTFSAFELTVSTH